MAIENVIVDSITTTPAADLGPGTHPDIVDMTDEERSAYDRLVAAGDGDAIGGATVFPASDPYQVIMFGWGDDEIPYGRVHVDVRTGRRLMPIDHGTALVARAETAQEVVRRVVVAHPPTTGGWRPEPVIAVDGRADRALILGVTVGDMTGSSQYAEHDRILLGRRIAQLATALPPGYQVAGTRLVDGRYAIEIGLDDEEPGRTTDATMLDLSGVDPAIAAQLTRLVGAIRSDRDDGNCPACESSGVTSERMRRESPRYMAAVDASDRFPDANHRPTPDHPRSWCWTCRSLLAAGFDPVALSDADAVEYRAHGQESDR